MIHWKHIARSTQALLGTVALAGAIMATATPRARADDDHDKCHHAMEKAKHRVEEAVEHHGENSPQAEHARHELNEEREHCWERYHGYWNTEDNTWHNQRDWDDERQERHDNDNH